MEPKEYRTLFKVEDSYWWFKSLHQLIINKLQEKSDRREHIKILDAGCGTGGLLDKINSYSFKVGIDYSDLAISFCQQRGLINIIQGDAGILPFKENQFDFIVSVDVLCNLKAPKDSEALEEFYRVLKKDGSLILNLPAFNFLRSSHDEAVHAQQRYRAKELRKMLLSAGFQVEKLTYINSFLFPFMACIRLIKKSARGKGKESDLKALPSVINTTLYILSSLERKLIRYINLPFGLSIFSVSKK